MMMSQLKSTMTLNRLLHLEVRRCHTFLLTIVFAFLSWPAISQAKDSHNYHYNLVMSEDNEVCKPLEKLYNKLLVEYLPYVQSKGYTYNPNYQGATDFEVWEPKKFAEAGFTLPEEGPVPYTYEVYPFEKDKPQLIRVYDAPWGYSFTTQVSLLKEDINLMNMLSSNADSKREESPFHEVTSEDIERDIGPEGLAAEQGGAIAGYRLQKMPGFDLLLSKYKAGDKHISLPTVSVSSPVSARPFLYEGKLYFVMNEYSSPSDTVRNNGYVVAYQITPISHDDVCYLSLERTKPHL